MPDHDREGLKGKVEEGKGKARQAWGELTDDKEQQAKGKAEELKGKGRQAKEEMAEEIDREADRSSRREQ